MHLCVDFYAGPSKECLIFFLFLVYSPPDFGSLFCNAIISYKPLLYYITFCCHKRFEHTSLICDFIILVLFHYYQFLSCRVYDVIGITGPLSQYGGFICRTFPEYFQNIFIPRKKFSYYGIELWTFSSFFYKISKIFLYHGRSPTFLDECCSLLLHLLKYW